MKHLATFIFLLATTISVCAENSSADILSEVNLARTQPRRYARIVEQQTARWRSSASRAAAREAIRFLQKVAPVPALKLSRGLSAAARSHAADSARTGIRSHYGSDGSSPWDRIQHFGRWSGGAAENICFGRSDARSVVIALIVDVGVAGRGHRRNLFDARFHSIGIGCGPHPSLRTMCVMDFAQAFTPRALPELPGISESLAALRGEF